MLCSQQGLASQGHVSSQPSLASQGGHGVKNINLGGGSGGVQTSMSGPVSLSGPGPLGGGGGGGGVSSGVSVSSPSMSTATTNTLPSFKDSMKLNVLGTVSNSFPDGSLPSITTATSSFHNIHNNEDDLRESVINDILEVILAAVPQPFVCHSRGQKNELLIFTVREFLSIGGKFSLSYLRRLFLTARDRSIRS